MRFAALTRAAARLLALMVLPALATCAGGERTTADAEGYVTSNGGIRLFYRLAGDGPDTVVAVHGGPGAGMNAFLPELEPLTRDFTIIFYDQRGGGRSTLPEDTALLKAEHHVADLEALRRHFALARMSVVAHSFGAVLVARYAETYPERLDRLVFLDATGPVRAAAARSARAEITSGDSLVEGRLRSVLGRLLSGTSEDPVADCEAYEALGREIAEMRGGSPVVWRGTTCTMPPEAVAYYYRYTAQLSPRSFGDWDFTSRLGALDAPLLVIEGALDTARLAAQRAWADAVPNGRLWLVPAAERFSGRPDEVFAEIRDFLKAR